MTDRIGKLIAALPEEVPAALIRTRANRFYLLDLDTGDAGDLLIFRDAAYFLIDSRYTEVAENCVKNAKVVEQTAPIAQIRELLAHHGAKSLLVEDKLSLRAFSQLEKGLEGICLRADGLLTDTLEELRSVKDEEEIRRVRQAQQITDECFTYICERIRPGLRQIDAALMMESFMRSNGASGIAFDTIFISGPDTSMPHGVPGERKLENGDFITMDYGARFGGYCTDMTRTVALGSVSREMEDIYDLVHKAQLAALAAAKPGVRCCDVDAVARDIIKEAGFGGYFGHGLGHSVGIQIHEEPRFSPRCEAIVRPGQLITVEPGVYLPGRFGVRIEDTVLITQDGCEPLGKTTKNLIIL